MSGHGSEPSVSVAALQQALAAEHAAIYAYGVVGAHLADHGPVSRLAADAYTTHRARRDRLTAMLTAAGARPTRAAAAYALPIEVTGRSSARRLARMTERRSAAVYADVVADTTGDVRAFAVDALVDCATRDVAWGGSARPLPGLGDRLTGRAGPSAGSRPRGHGPSDR